MTETRFLYHASALAVGGQIRRPYDEILDSQASSVLPIVGGKASAQVRNYRYHGLISIRSATSTVIGNVGRNEKGRVYNTLATVAIEGLNIADLITADRVVARLVSEKSEHDEELPVQPLGSYFTNLRIAGQPVDFPPIGSLVDTRTGSDLLDIAGSDGGSTQGKVYNDRKAMTSLFEPRDMPAGVEIEKAFESTREVSALRQAPPPWAVRIPGFGKVYFGELLITRYARRLTMIRLEMGSPVQGDVVIASTEGNGSTYP